MDSVAPGGTGLNWTMTPTHPYLLFLQRWWFTAQATAMGHSVLSLDSDLHLWTSPLELLTSAAYRSYHLITQAQLRHRTLLTSRR